MSKKLQVRHRRGVSGEVDGVRYDEYQVGPEGRPAYVVVIRTAERSSAIAQRACEIIGASPAGRRLEGAPMILLAPGEEFEVWEVETPG